MSPKEKVDLNLDIIKKWLSNIYVFNTTTTVYLFLKILYKKLITFDLDQRAAAVSFSFMLAIFPGTLFLFTLIPYIPIDNLDAIIMGFMKTILPASFYETVNTTILEIVSRPRVDILSFGFLFTYFAATNGMMSLMRAFNMALRQKEKRNFFKARWIAFVLTSILVMVLFIAVIILIVGKIALNYFTEKGILDQTFSFWGLQLLGYGAVFIVFFVGICCIYYFAPAMHKKLNFFNFGALFASILAILATNGFSYYLANFNSYNRLYGSIGTLIGIMVLIYLIALILILGFEVNISLRSAIFKSSKKKLQ